MKSSSSIAFNLYPDEGLTSCVICVINVSVPIRYAVKYLWDTKHQTQWNGLFDSGFRSIYRRHVNCNLEIKRFYLVCS